MNFIKGTMLGVMFGMVAGAMNSDMVMEAVRKSQKHLKRMKRKFKM